MWRAFAKFGSVDVIGALKVGGGNISVGGGLGEKFYVHNSSGYDTGPGTIAKPWKTLDYALGKCTADKDDEVHLMAGHSETITGAGGITLDKAGASVIGHGRYDSRPNFLMDGATTVTMLVTAADMTLFNCKFEAGHADIAKCMLITAKGFRLDSCLFEENVATENWVDCIHVSAANNDADGLELINNEIIMNDAACVTAIDLIKDINDAKIIGNRITGDFDAAPYAPIYMATDEVPLNILVMNNFIHNKHDGHAAVGISIDCITATGWIIGNHIGAQDTAGDTGILAGAAGLYCGENYQTGILGTKSGYLYPAADS